MKKLLMILTLIFFTSFAYADVLVELKVKKSDFEFTVRPIYQTVNYPVNYVMTLNETTFNKTSDKPVFHYIWHPNPHKIPCFKCTFEIFDSSGSTGYDEINIILFDEDKLKENFAYFDIDSFVLHILHINIKGTYFNLSLKTLDNEQWEVFNKVESFPEKQSFNYHYIVGNKLIVNNVSYCMNGNAYKINATFKMETEEIFILEKVTVN